MIYFHCQLCRTSLSAQDNAAGQQMRCPNCLAAVTVPAAAHEAVPATADVAGSFGDTTNVERGVIRGGVAAEIPIAPSKTPPHRSPPATPPSGGTTASSGRRPPTQYGKRYGFNCVYCSSRLEATETMAGHEGQCPTCGNSIVIPILNRHGQLIDPVTKQIIKQDPHPVHAYAAAGERAPQIVRTEEGLQQIICAKCKRPSPITANNCKHCGMPFTMEGTAPEAAGGAGGFATASLVLGIIGVPFFCTMLVPLLAIVFGVVALMKPKEAEAAGRGQAIAGVVCGVVGFGGWVLWYAH